MYLVENSTVHLWENEGKKVKKKKTTFVYYENSFDFTDHPHPALP